MNSMQPFRGNERIGPKSPRDGEAQGRLIDAASRLFAEQGYRGTRIRDVVEDAGVNQAAVNYYFGGKDGLYAATIESLAGTRRSRIVDPEGAGSPPEQLHQAVLALLDRMLQTEPESRLSRILAHEMMSPSEHFDALAATMVGTEVERLRRIVLKLCAPDTDEDTVRTHAMGILGQCLFFLCARTAVEKLYPGFLTAERLPALARRITDFAIAAITDPARNEVVDPR